MEIGIIGSGFAAKRIYKIIKNFNNAIKINFYSKFPRVILIEKKKIKLKNLNLKNIKFEEDLFFIANNTAEHFKYISLLLKNNKAIYVEKPLCTSMKELKKIKTLSYRYKKKIEVGFQFRENRCLKFLKKEISKNRKNIISVLCYSGENVKNYHKNENYLNSYTINKKKGGGVVLTQSHQIDYLNFLFGKLKILKAIKSNKNNLLNLKTNTESNILYLCKTNDEIPISCNINFFGLSETFILIFFKNKIIKWDYYKNLIIIKNKKRIKNFFLKQSRNDMFDKKIRYFLKNFTKPNSKKELNEIIDSMQNIINLKLLIQ